MIGIYFFMIFNRFFTHFLFQNWLFTQGYDFTVSEFAVFINGGLKGSVSMCFTILVFGDEDLPPALRSVVTFFKTILN
jgi:hypothetical protein